jgi:hypothetical protein
MERQKKIERSTIKGKRVYWRLLWINYLE